MDENITKPVNEEQPAGTAGENQAPEGNKPEIDYKAELEKEQQLHQETKDGLKKAEDKIVDLKRTSKAKTEEVEEDDDDPYGIKNIISSEIGKFKQSIATDMVQDVLDEELNSLSTSEDEKNLILYHYQNTIKPSGYSKGQIKADLAKAKLLANAKKIQDERDEIARATVSKSDISSASGANQDKLTPGTMPKLSAGDLALLQRRGIDPKTIKFTNG